MGILKKLNPFAGESEEEKAQAEEDAEMYDPAKGPECGTCGKPGADKRFAGMWFHKKCLRKARKQAKGMV